MLVAGFSTRPGAAVADPGIDVEDEASLSGAGARRHAEKTPPIRTPPRLVRGAGRGVVDDFGTGRLRCRLAEMNQGRWRITSSVWVVLLEPIAWGQALDSSYLSTA